MSVVQFHCDASLFGGIPEPKPSSKAIPEYFKNIRPQTSNHPMSGTVKRCLPFLDAMSEGFVIPLWADMFVLANGGEIRFDFPPNFTFNSESISQHDYVQAENHPLSSTPYGKMLLKFMNPWIVSTEEGVSCLFTSPLNHMETRFKVLDGVVDTDTYYNNVNFPFVWTGGDGEFLIKRGTPLVQVIPFKRETFTMSGVEQIDEDRQWHTRAKLGSYHRHGYRTEFWSKRKEADGEE